MIEIPNEITEFRNENYLIELFKKKYDFEKKGLELRKDNGNSNEKGIGIYSNKTFKKGDTIIKIEPYVWSVSKHGLVCDYCLKNKMDLNSGYVDAFGYSNGSSNISLKRCTGCKVVYYCSTECQKNAWQIHKHECKILSTVPTGKNINTKSTTMLLRLFIKRNLEKLSLSSSTTTTTQNDYSDLTKFGQFEIIDNLLNHKEKRINNSNNSNDYKSFSSGFSSLLNQDPKTKAPVVLDYLLKLEPNCITVPKCDGLSIGLYPLMVFFNHSCKPNLSIINNRKELLIITNKNIEKGEELFINYSPAICYRNERIENLKQCFYFNCNCELCGFKEDEELFINCKLCKNGIINQFNNNNNNDECFYKCNKCLKIYKSNDEEILKKINILKSLENKLNQHGDHKDDGLENEIVSLIKLYCKEYHFTDPSFYWIINKTQLFYKLGHYNNHGSLFKKDEVSNLHSRYQSMLKYHLLENQGLEFEYCKQMIEYINILTSSTPTPSMDNLKLAYELLTNLFKNYLVNIDFYGFDKDSLVLLHFNLEFQLNSNIK